MKVDLPCQSLAMNISSSSLLGREDHGIRELWTVCAGFTDWGAGYHLPRHPHLGKRSALPPSLPSLQYPCNSQGSVVVFGSWPDWTSEDVTSQDYCKDLPMHFAFGILVTAWVSILFLVGWKIANLCVRVGDDPPDVLRLYLHHLLYRLCCRLPGNTGSPAGPAGRGLRCPGLTRRRTRRTRRTTTVIK